LLLIAAPCAIALWLLRRYMHTTSFTAAASFQLAAT